MSLQHSLKTTRETSHLMRFSKYKLRLTKQESPFGLLEAHREENAATLEQFCQLEKGQEHEVILITIILAVGGPVIQASFLVLTGIASWVRLVDRIWGQVFYFSLENHLNITRSMVAKIRLEYRNHG